MLNHKFKKNQKMNYREVEKVSEQIEGQNDLREPSVNPKRNFDKLTQKYLVAKSSRNEQKDCDDNGMVSISNEYSINTNQTIEEDTHNESSQFPPKDENGDDSIKVSKRRKVNDEMENVVDEHWTNVIVIHRALFIEKLPDQLEFKCSMNKCEVCFVDLVSLPGSFIHH